MQYEWGNKTKIKNKLEKTKSTNIFHVEFK